MIGRSDVFRAVVPLLKQDKFTNEITGISILGRTFVRDSLNLITVIYIYTLRNERILKRARKCTRKPREKRRRYLKRIADIFGE